MKSGHQSPALLRSPQWVLAPQHHTRAQARSHLTYFLPVPKQSACRYHSSTLVYPFHTVVSTHALSGCGNTAPLSSAAFPRGCSARVCPCSSFPARDLCGIERSLKGSSDGERSWPLWSPPYMHAHPVSSLQWGWESHHARRWGPAGQSPLPSQEGGEHSTAQRGPSPGAWGG